MRLLTRERKRPVSAGPSWRREAGRDVQRDQRRHLLAARFRGLSAGFVRLGRFRLLLSRRFRASPRRRHFADARIAGEDEVAGVERSFLEIRRIDGKNLPAGHLLTQQLDGPHFGKLEAQALVMLLSGGQPDSVVSGLVGLSRRMRTIFSWT